MLYTQKWSSQLEIFVIYIFLRREKTFVIIKWCKLQNSCELVTYFQASHTLIKKYSNCRFYVYLVIFFDFILCFKAKSRLNFDLRYNDGAIAQQFIKLNSTKRTEWERQICAMTEKIAISLCVIYFAPLFITYIVYE